MCAGCRAGKCHNPTHRQRQTALNSKLRNGLHAINWPESNELVEGKTNRGPSRSRGQFK